MRYIKLVSVSCLAALALSACSAPASPLTPPPSVKPAVSTAAGIPALPVEPAPTDPAKEFLTAPIPNELSVSKVIRTFEVVSTENAVIDKRLPREEFTLPDKAVGFKIGHSWTRLGSKLEDKIKSETSYVLVSGTAMVNPAGVLMGASTLSNSPATVMQRPGKYVLQATCIGNGGEFFISASATADGKGFLVRGVCGKTESATYEHTFSAGSDNADEQLGTFKVATTGAPRPGVVVAKFAPAS